jgi:hypothetical protein
METESQRITKVITKPDSKLSLLDSSSSLFPIQKIVLGLLASKNKPMSAGQIASEYYLALSDNIVMNWRLCNAAAQVSNFLGSDVPKQPGGTTIKPIPNKALDGLSIAAPLNDYSAKLEFVRKAANWLLGKNSKGVILSAKAISNNLMMMPPVQSMNGKAGNAKFYAYVDPLVLREWRQERETALAEINTNPLLRFDEENLRLLNLSNYLLSLRLGEIEKISSRIQRTLATIYPDYTATQAKQSQLQAVSQEVLQFIDKLGLPKSVLNTSLLIQFYSVPFADKLDGSVFARHFTK